ncbi:receptor for egg jelly 3 precursor [Strongylocentrotus purpuratus]|uniref:Receptor for egg jelly 3 protein n=2 Tax=Strongylocentrotus purpuratus TaxID=7668 RepID=Q95V80_STRPU|nr:receptor for egg jelly 3 precursor [Strongylocentrotus purpuratus]AAL26499.1 receptor for egg jelly 3 protein [Strongylocentrotus purpuratus]|eukprot:NP_999801.1 receptor for egg jelly 3 precursor [Strongylocentrotus purpuratus]
MEFAAAMRNVVFISFLLNAVFKAAVIAGTETEIICEGQNGVIDCGVDIISISSSVYGRTDTNTCAEDDSNTNCVLDVAPELAYCNGQAQCSIEALNLSFGDPCQGVLKYLNVTYICKDSVCEADWVHNNGSCYLFHEERTTWESAREFCLGLGADLVSIHSANENAFVNDGISGNAWIGITDQESEGVFSTFTDGTPIDFQNFPGTASSHQGEAYDCAFINLTHGQWSWRDCENRYLAVCKHVSAITSTIHPITTLHTTPSVTTTPAIQEIVPTPFNGTQLQTTTQPSTTINNDEVPSCDATSAITIGSSYLCIELFLLPDYVSSIDNIFRVNDTVVAMASVLGSFQPLSSEIVWSITNHLSGDSVQYTVYSEDAVLVLFTTTSIFTIEATAVGTDSQDLAATASAVVLPAIQILCPTHVYASREVRCALLTDSVVTHSNYTFCFDSSEDSCSMANPRSWSLDDIPYELMDRVSVMDGFLASFLNHTYSGVGSYMVTAEIFQTLATAVEVNVTVDHECISSLRMVKGHGNTTHPAVFLRASEIAISAHIELDEKCIGPMTSDFKWWIFTSTVDDDVVIAFEKITHTPQVTIPSGTLPYGIYSLNLKADTHLRTSDEVIGEVKIITWLEIQPSPLVAFIKGGASRSHGVSSNLTVDGANSYDPDVNLRSSSDLTFLWYCVLVDPDIMYSSLDAALQNTDDACFEGEEIMMNSSSSKVEIITSELQANVIMNFWLIVSKDGRTSDSTQQRIQLTPGLLPEIEISCISNCNTYFFTAERLVLHASCSNCDSENEDVVFLWSLESDHTSIIGDLSSQTSTGLDQPYLVVKPHTFDSISETGSIIIRVTGYTSNSSSGGYAEFSVKFNAPPTSGSCSVIPIDGYALQTDFTVACQGFTDVDDPLTYEMLIYSSVDVVDGDFVGLGEGFQLYEGSESLQDGLYLPVGDGAHDYSILLQVNVIDCFMASTSVFLIAAVHPPTIDTGGENGTRELLNMTSSVESNVNSLLAVGDTGQAAQLINALGSILNSIGDEDDDAEDNDEWRDTRSEIRSSLVDSVAAIPVESMSSLRQSSAALAVITHNKREISTDVQVKAANALSEMTSFLKAESGSYTQSQGTIESAGTILVEGLSNIFSAAKETESLPSNNTSQDAQESKAKSNKELTEAAVSAINDIQDAIVAGKIPSEEATIITSPTLSIAVGSISRDMLSEATFRGSDEDDVDGGLGSFTMPSRDGVLDDTLDSVNGTVISMQMSTLRWNPFSWGAGEESLNPRSVGIQLKADHNILQVRNLSDVISVYLPVEEPLSRDPLSVHITKDFSASLLVNHSSMAEDGALHLIVRAENEPMVTLSICTANISINETSCVGNAMVVRSSNEDLLNTAANFTWSVSAADLSAADGMMISLYDGKDQPVYQHDNITLSIFMHTPQCTFWNEDEQAWGSAGCKGGPLSNPTKTHCLCNHLTFFGSSLFVPPNKINIFKDAKLFLTFVDNPIVVSFVACVLAGFVLVAVWARRKDKRDARRAAVTVLEDNDPYHQYLYNVTVVTGFRRGSGTTATVTLTLTGKEGQSDPHVLHDSFSPILDRGSTDSFLLTTAKGLGDIQALRLWHNNAGSSPNWYVSHCIVHDLESDERYYFICNSWMMVEFGGVGLDNTFHIASSKDLHKFGHLFTAQTVRDLRDGHLWLSVLMRPKHSNFTCLQRVWCCLSLLMCCMMTSIMFYGIPNDPADQVMDFGTFRITIKEIIIGIQSSLIAFPVNLLIVQIFRHIRPSLKVRTAAHRENDMVKSKPDIAHSLSSIDLARKEDVESDSADHKVTSTSMSKSFQNEERETLPGHLQSPEKSSHHWVGGGDSSSTSSKDDNPGNSSASSSTTTLPSRISFNSSMFRQEMDDFVLRSVSAVMKEWGGDKRSKRVEIFGHGGLDKVDQPQSEAKEDTTSQSIQEDPKQLKEEIDLAECSRDSPDDLKPPQIRGVTHNYYLYSRLLDMVKGLSLADRFYDPEEHKKALSEAQTIVMTAMKIDTPPTSPDESLLSEDVSLEKIKLKQRIRGLPHACVYIAWLLVFSTVLASSYITMLYGLKYGKQSSIDWLISLFIATFQSIFITQPIKILFLAVFVSLIFKQIEPEEDFSDDIEELQVANAQETQRALQKRRNTMAHYQPPAASAIHSHLRNKQLKTRMYSLLWQIAGFLCFFYLLITITYTQRDRQAYWMTRGTKGLFFYHKNKDYHLMNDFRSFLKWADSTLLPGLLSENRWGAEKQSTLIGGGLRLRQVRVKPSSCETHPLFVDLINDCRALFTPESEDRELYNASWSQPIVNMSALLNSSQTVEEWSLSNYSPWHFYPDKAVGMWGHATSLPSSGYIWVLGSMYEEAKDSLAEMVDARWLDARTRALFVEWTSYNANTNLFCVVTFLMETPASGGLLKLPEVQAVRLHRYAANYKLFVILCEILFVVALFFVMYREYVRYKPIGIRKYLSDKWNLLEIAIIVNCIVSAGLYIYRYVITKQLFKQMRDESVRFVGFRTAATSDNALGYSLAVIIILSCVKFLYLLRLNPRMYLLTSVISDCYHEVIAFTFLIFILILSFAFPMTIMFGSNLPDYRDITKTALNLFITLPDNFVYEDLKSVQRVLGPLILLLFQFLSCYLFLDLLIAALNESMVTIRRHPPPPSENRMLGLLLLSKIFSLLGIPDRFHISLD